MRPGRYYLKHRWVYLLVWLCCTGGYATKGAATATPILRDVRIVFQSERWHVVLSGFELGTYKAVKTNAPLQLVLELPGTISNRVSYRRIFDSDIISEIKTLVIVDHPQPLTRVVMGLKEDVPYRISRSQGEIRVSFGAPSLHSKTDSAPGNKKDESLAVVGPVDPTQDPLAATPGLPEETSADAAARPLTETGPIEAGKTRMAAIPRLPEKKTGYSARDVGGDNLPPASKLLAIRAVEVEEKLVVSILVNGSPENFRAFHLTNPPLLVVELMGVQAAEVESVLHLSGPMVDKVRLGVQPDRVRVVFELIPPMGLPYQVVSGDDRLQVSFMPGSSFAAVELTGKPQTASRATGDSVQRFVEQWRLAWEKGDLPSYMACYHPQFKTRGMGLTGWGKYKKKLFQRSPARVVRLKDITAELEGATALVLARQEYRSGTHQDFGLKTLHLLWHRGRWAIYREIWQPLPDPG